MISNNRTFDNKRLLRFFTETYLVDAEKQLDLECYKGLGNSRDTSNIFTSNIVFDELSKQTLSKAINRMWLDVLNALDISRFPKRIPKKHVEDRTVGEVLNILQHGELAVIATEGDYPHPYYMSQCLKLAKELDKLNQLMQVSDYERVAQFLMLPLFRYADLVRHSNFEFHIYKQNIEAEKNAFSLRQKNNINQRFKSKQEQAFKAITYAKKLWIKNLFANYDHVEMTAYLVNEAANKDGSLLYPDLTENYLRSKIKELAVELGKNVKGLPKA